MMNYSLGILESLNKIFAGVLVGAVKEDNPNFTDIIKAAKGNINRFIGRFPSNIFQDEYAIFYEIISTLNAPIFDINQLNSIIENNRDLILNSPRVSLSSMLSTQIDSQVTDDEKVDAIKANMVEKFIELSNRYVTEAEFDSACEIFVNWFQNQFMLDTAQSMSLIMSSSGYEERKPGRRVKKYAGVTDCKKYYNERVRILNELSEHDRVRSTVLDASWFEKDMQLENVKDKEILMTIGIKEIDDMVGSLRRSNMLGILGPPKGGKTRFTNFIVSRALSLGLNVCVWSLEGTKEEWIAMQVAALIRRENNMSFSSKKILERDYNDGTDEGETTRELVTAAKLKLAVDPTMGRLSFIESTAYVEDFIDILEGHYENENPFDVIVIDQLIDILSRNGMGKVERISQAYQELKLAIANRFKRKVLAVMPAQLKQSVVDFLRSNPGETIDVTSGGESAETIRTPDEVIGLFSSKEERSTNMVHMYSVASRHNADFQDFVVGAELGCCYFESNSGLNK